MISNFNFIYGIRVKHYSHARRVPCDGLKARYPYAMFRSDIDAQKLAPWYAKVQSYRSNWGNKLTLLASALVNILYRKKLSIIMHHMGDWIHVWCWRPGNVIPSFHFFLMRCLIDYFYSWMKRTRSESDLYCFETLDVSDDSSDETESNDHDGIQPMIDDVYVAGVQVSVSVNAIKSNNYNTGIVHRYTPVIRGLMGRFQYPVDHLAVLVQKETPIIDIVKNKFHLTLLDKYGKGNEFFLAVLYMERYRALKKHEYGLPLVCLWIAMKMERDRGDPWGADLLFTFRRVFPNFSARELVDLEIEVAQTLDYKFVLPTIWEFVCWGLELAEITQSDLRARALANARLCNYSTSFVGFKPSLVAAGCIVEVCTTPTVQSILSVVFSHSHEDITRAKKLVSGLVCDPRAP